MSVEQSWNRIVAWLSDNAPRTAAGIRQPADAVVRGAVARHYPQPWSDDLTQWYSLHDGETDPEMTFTGVLPAMRLLSLEQMTSTSEMYADIYDDPSDDTPLEAGEMTADYLPEFVPIGDEGTGVAMFVDLRPGPLHGCVTTFEREDAAGDPTWNSVGELLDDLADALTEGRDCGGWTPQVRDGFLTWGTGDDQDDEF